MSWPEDRAKLDRVRALMAERDLDALVVRAPDNVLYLTNFWGMKGYDACVFPREGEPVLICLEASAEDADRMSWTKDVRLVQGYAPNDPRPVPARTLEAALADSLTFYRYPREHWKMLRTNNPLERLLKEVRRRTKVAEQFPSEESALLLVTARLRRIHESWQERRYLDMQPLYELERREEARAAVA